jgi:hypothetical protein
MYPRTLRWLYILNLGVLATHEIDSAYWHEWRLFHLPGGVQLFVVLNFVLLVGALYGFERLIAGTRRGHIFALVLAAAGIFAFAIHGTFLLLGEPEFRLPVSLALIVAIGLVSLAQGAVAIARLRDDSAS